MSEFHYKTLPALAAYIERVGAEQLNFRRFMIKEHQGNYYTERAIIRITTDLAIVCSVKDYAPTKEEEEAIKIELTTAKFPKSIGASAAKYRDLLKKSGANKKDMYAMIDRRNGEVIMAQQRLIQDDGRKAYIPWTFFSDGEWRRMEPDGPLPFWKPAEARSPRIMIHEGAKAAQYVEWMVTDDSLEARKVREQHPWAEALAQYEHWGIIGGALAPHRANYADISREKPIEVVYVCDNDPAGKSALQEVSKHYGGSLKGIMFDNRWPLAWDLGDSFPSSFFTKAGRYKGPSLSGLTIPSTYATENIPNPSGTGRPITVMRRVFREEWFHSVQPEVYIHHEWPNRILSGPEFNSFVAPFSGVDDTARLLRKDAASKGAVLKYDPSRPPGIYAAGDEGRFINTHAPSDIKPEEGDVSCWLEYLEWLFPIEEDRLEVMRWCATLIARPDIKMLYGMLLISEEQGVGKSTLGEKILAPLVGAQNVSTPAESDIVDTAFNYWLAHKRLAIIHEIYSGHSAKAYNKLKSVVTDKVVMVNKKHQAAYEVQNWIHVFACSNSKRALKLSGDDRRWFVPKVTEQLKPVKYWLELNDWLTNQGGLEKIAGWARSFLIDVKPVMPGDRAPWSTLKQEVVEEGMSAGQLLVVQTLKRIKQDLEGKEVIILDRDLVELVRTHLYGGQHNDRLEKPSTLRKLAKGLGWYVGANQVNFKDWGIKVAGPRLVCSHAALAEMSPTQLDKRGLKPLDLNEFVEI